MKLMNVSPVMVTVTTAAGSHFLAPRQVLELGDKETVTNLQKIQARIKLIEDVAPKAQAKPSAAPAADSK